MDCQDEMKSLSGSLLHIVVCSSLGFIIFFSLSLLFIISVSLRTQRMENFVGEYSILLNTGMCNYDHVRNLWKRQKSVIILGEPWSMLIVTSQSVYLHQTPVYPSPGKMSVM